MSLNLLLKSLQLRQWNVYKTGQKVAEFPIHSGCVGPAGFRPVGKLFSLGADNEHVLTCGPNGGIVYKASSTYYCSKTKRLTDIFSDLLLCRGQ